MTEIDPLRFVLDCLLRPCPNSVFRQTWRWLRGERPRHYTP